MSKLDLNKVIREFLNDKVRSYGKYKTQTLQQITSIRRRTRSALKNSYKNFSISHIVSSGLRTVKNHPLSSFLILFGGTSYFLHQAYKYHMSKKDKTSVVKRVTEKKFLRFASVEYNGQVYMTPLDFLNSIVETNPRVGNSRRIVFSREHLDYILRRTPPLEENSSKFFAKLGYNGIISYSEYIFLISLLIKPYSAFEIDFKMLDTDHSNTIDKEEYLIMEKIISRKSKLSKGNHNKENFPELRFEELEDDEVGLHRKKVEDTTLIVHLFGHDGKQTLEFKTFQKFVLNLQKEILKLEFNQFSHGLPFITEIDFAKLLLKYTYLDEDYNYENYIDRLIQRVGNLSAREGITFDEFSAFFSFLYMLDEFYFTIKYYSLLNPEISRVDFHDAFKILPGTNLSWHLIDILFNIFDIDGTGNVNYADFNRILNDRLCRGFKKPVKKKKYWKSLQTCIRNNMGEDPNVVFYKREGDREKEETEPNK